MSPGWLRGPAPVPRCPDIDAVAYGLLSLVALFFPFQLLIIIVSAARWEWPRELVEGNLGIAAVEGTAVLVAIGLLRRQAWARPTAIVVLVLASLLLVGMAVWPFISPPEQDHGLMYVVMGSATLGVACVGGLVAMLRHPRSHCFVPPS